MYDLSRLSLNQMTVESWGVREAVQGCARAGIPYIGLWRHKVEEVGTAESARLVRDAGIGVSSLCRGGMFPASTELDRQRSLDDNRRALEEAAELGTDVLVLVCGGMPDRDLERARAQVAEGIAELVPYATELGVRLGIEPLHPAFAADRSVIVHSEQPSDIAERLDSRQVGVVVDTYHVWWDPNLYREIERAGPHLFGYHVDDWLVPNPDPLMGRGLMGDGVIDFERIGGAIERAGYSGPIEVEIFNHDVWSLPPDEVLELVKRSFLAIGRGTSDGPNVRLAAAPPPTG